MKTIFLLFLLFPFAIHAQTEQSMIEKSIQSEASFDESGAFDNLKRVLQINPHNYYALWKSSELCSRLGNRQATKAAKINYFLAGKQYAEKAIQINPNGADGYYVLSLAMGKLAQNSSGKERINMVKEIKSNAEIAVQLNPQHGRAWHVLGKWNYEVSNLNAFEKAALKFFYGDFPQASLAQSIQAYEKAKRYEPDFALNDLELAKAYKSNGDNAKAIDLLKKLPAVPNKTSDDTRIKAEGRQLLQHWTS